MSSNGNCPPKSGLTASTGLLQLKVDRVHWTKVFRDLDTSTEEIRYVFSGANQVSVVPLIWRRREVQANMATLDADDTNLVYLPSRETTSVTANVIRALLGQISADLAQSVPNARATVASGESDLLAVTAYEVSESAEAKAAEALDRIEKICNTHATRRKLQQLARMVGKLQYYYIPFVQLESPCPTPFTFVKHRVDILRPFAPRKPAPGSPSLKDLLGVYAVGVLRLRIPIPLTAFDEDVPWSPPEALHLRVVLPLGSRIFGPLEAIPYEGGSRTATGPFEVLKTATHDDEELYLYVRKEDARRMIDPLSERLRELMERFLSALAGGLLDSALLAKPPTPTGAPKPPGAEAVEAGSSPTVEPLEGGVQRAPSGGSPPHPEHKRTPSATKESERTLRRFSDLTGANLAAVPAKAGQKRSGAESRSPWLTFRVRLPGTAYALLGLLWFTVIAGYALGGWNLSKPTLFETSLSVLLLVVLTAIVYSLERPLVVRTTSAHSVAAVAAVIIPFPAILDRLLEFLEAALAALALVH